jgi:hypothetical protein
VCFDFLYNSEIFLTLRRIQRDMTISVHRSSCKIPITFCHISIKLNFQERSSKNARKLNFMKVRPVRVELFHTDGQRHKQRDRQTYMAKLIAAFCNFAKAPKNMPKFWEKQWVFYLIQKLKVLMKSFRRRMQICNTILKQEGPASF